MEDKRENFVVNCCLVARHRRRRITEGVSSAENLNQALSDCITKSVDNDIEEDNTILIRQEGNTIFDDCGKESSFSRAISIKGFSLGEQTQDGDLPALTSTETSSSGPRKVFFDDMELALKSLSCLDSVTQTYTPTASSSANSTFSFSFFPISTSNSNGSKFESTLPLQSSHAFAHTLVHPSSVDQSPQFLAFPTSTFSSNLNLDSLRPCSPGSTSSSTGVDIAALKMVTTSTEDFFGRIVAQSSPRSACLSLTSSSHLTSASQASTCSFAVPVLQSGCQLGLSPPQSPAARPTYPPTFPTTPNSGFPYGVVRRKACTVEEPPAARPDESIGNNSRQHGDGDGNGDGHCHHHRSQDADVRAIPGGAPISINDYRTDDEMVCVQFCKSNDLFSGGTALDGSMAVMAVRGEAEEGPMPSSSSSSSLSAFTTFDLGFGHGPDHPHSTVVGLDCLTRSNSRLLASWRNNEDVQSLSLGCFPNSNGFINSECVTPSNNDKDVHTNVTNGINSDNNGNGSCFTGAFLLSYDNTERTEVTNCKSETTHHNATISHDGPVKGSNLPLSALAASNGVADADDTGSPRCMDFLNVPATSPYGSLSSSSLHSPPRTFSSSSSYSSCLNDVGGCLAGSAQTLLSSPFFTGDQFRQASAPDCAIGLYRVSASNTDSNTDFTAASCEAGGRNTDERRLQDTFAETRRNTPSPSSCPGPLGLPSSSHKANLATVFTRPAEGRGKPPRDHSLSLLCLAPSALSPDSLLRRWELRSCPSTPSTSMGVVALAAAASSRVPSGPSTSSKRDRMNTPPMDRRGGRPRPACWVEGLAVPAISLRQENEASRSGGGGGDPASTDGLSPSWSWAQNLAEAYYKEFGSEADTPQHLGCLRQTKRRKTSIF